MSISSIIPFKWHFTLVNVLVSFDKRIKIFFCACLQRFFLWFDIDFIWMTIDFQMFLGLLGLAPIWDVGLSHQFFRDSLYHILSSFILVKLDFEFRCWRWFGYLTYLHIAGMWGWLWFCLESVLVWWLWFGANCKARLVLLVCLAWSFVIGKCSNLVFVLSKQKLFCVDPIGGNIWICLSYHLIFKVNICSFFWFLFSLELF